MAEISRVNGTPAAGGFYGYQFVVVKVAANASVFTADSVNGTTQVITEGGYSKAIKAAQQVGSIIILAARDADYFTAVFDRSTLNNGAGGTTSGTFGAFKDALDSEVGGATWTITTSTALNGVGTFTYA
jgi:hypothetical protein